jgi:hypothetical protein
MSLAAELTIVVVTSPAPCHPSTEMLDRLLCSLQLLTGLGPEARCPTNPQSPHTHMPPHARAHLAPPHTRLCTILLQIVCSPLGGHTQRAAASARRGHHRRLRARCERGHTRAIVALEK